MTKDYSDIISPGAGRSQTPDDPTQPRPPEPLVNAPWPVVVLTVGIIVAYLVQSRFPLEGVSALLGFSPAELLRGHPAGLLSSLFVHGNWAHALMNAAFILAFGAPVARFFGPRAGGAVDFFLFYTFCGVLACLGFAALHWGQETSLIGASGAASGLMGAAADAAIANGGRVVGVIPTFLQQRERSYPAAQLSELHVVKSMHERKAMMAQLADGFLALPGGFGTLEELCEMSTWTQLGVHAKAVVLVNVRGYYDPLLAMFDRAHASGFIDRQHRGLVLSAPHTAAALTLIEQFAPPATAAQVDIEEA